jgi:hypothetical protein
MEYTDLKEIERRPKQYWNADGFPSLVMGALLILWGLALALPTWLPAGSWVEYYWMAVPLVLIFSGLAANAIVKKLKQRFTFPRTGYVEWTPPSGAIKIVTALLGTAMAVAAVFVIRSSTVQGFTDLLPPACALFCALGALIIAKWHKLPHYLWLSALSLVLVFIIIRFRMDLTHNFILLWLSLGAGVCLVGGVQLHTYLRRNPRSQEDEA